LSEIHTLHSRKLSTDSTLATLISVWQAATAERVREGTMETYDAALQHLPPAFALRRATAIPSTDFEHLFATLLNGTAIAGKPPVGISTLHKLKQVLSSAYVEAGRAQPMDNPVKPARIAPLPPREFTNLSTASISDLLTKAAAEGRAANDLTLPILLHLAFMTALRRGELAGLRWSGVNLDAGYLNVRDSENRHGDSKLKTPGSWRTVGLHPITVDALRSWRHAQEERASQAGVSLNSDSYVLSPAADSSGPYKPNSITQRWNRFRKRHGYVGEIGGGGPPRFQDFRTSHITAQSNAGVPEALVKRRAGHSKNSKITHDIYTGRDHDMDVAALGALAALVPTAEMPRMRRAEGGTRRKTSTAIPRGTRAT
jgi:integrase